MFHLGATLSSTALLALTCAHLVEAATLRTETIAQLDLGSFLESLVVRPNSDILTTNFGLTPDTIGVYTVMHPNSCNRTTKLLAPIPYVQTLWGISEVTDEDGLETYIVLGGNLSSFSPAIPAPGSWKAFKLSFTSRGEPRVDLVSTLLNDTILVNGLSPVPGDPNSVLIADSIAGAIGRLDISTGSFNATALKYPEMLAPANSSLPYGVASVKIRGSYLYFNNAALASFYRIPIDSQGNAVAGATPELVATTNTLAPGLDDFVLDSNGNIWATSNSPGNVVIFVDAATGKSKVVFGGANDTMMADDSSLAFGRGNSDKNVLYVCTGRDLTDEAAQAKVVAIRGL